MGKRRWQKELRPLLDNGIGPIARQGLAHTGGGADGHKVAVIGVVVKVAAQLTWQFDPQAFQYMRQRPAPHEHASDSPRGANRSTCIASTEIADAATHGV